MSKLRINNATLFVTVLGACLGLVAAGASSHAHQTTSSVLSEIASCSSATILYRYGANQAASSFTALYHSPARPFSAQGYKGAATASYRNTNPLTATSHILVVTTLARASLESNRA
jgi:hypothetical protein